MAYTSLYKLHYKLQREDEYKKIYEERFNSPLVRRLGLVLEPYNRRKKFEMFYCVPEELLLLQDDILHKYGRLLGMLRSVPPVGIRQLLYSKMIDEIKSSNDIEGVYSTRKEIQDAIDTPSEQRGKYRLGSIVNKYIYVLDNEVMSILSSSDLRKLYDDIMYDEISRGDKKDLPDGRIFRKGPVTIVSETQKIIHTGVMPEEKIIHYMDCAIDILNNRDIPLFTRLALFHYLFGYVHPFYDGNGRTARFVTSLYLAKEFHPLVGLQLSANIKKNRRDYYKLFSIVEHEFNSGDLTPFIIGTYKFINGAVDTINEELNRKLHKYHAAEDAIHGCSDLKTIINNKNTFSIVNILLQAAVFSDAGATYKEITDTARISENTLRNHLKKIPEKYIISIRSSIGVRVKLDLNQIE